MQINLKIKPFAPVIVFCLMFWLVLSTQASGGTLKKIELTDGSVIQAEVLSFSNGIYHLKSETLGTFSLSEEKIESIGFKNRSSSSRSDRGTATQRIPSNLSGANNQQVQQQVQEMTNRLMRDPEAMDLIQSLQNDPSVKGILQDQDLMRAINQQDFGRLQADPKVQSLMRNKALGKILERAQ